MMGMRRACNGTGHIGNEAGDAVGGVALGYDHCAEHEHGIKDLMRSFGMVTDAPGIARYRIRDYPVSLGWMEGEDLKGNKFKGYGTLNSQAQGLASRETPQRWSDDQPFSAYWGQGGFLIIGWDPEAIQTLETLSTAILEGNAVLTMGGKDSGNPFGGAGPCFMWTHEEPEVWAAFDVTLKEQQAAYDKWCAEWAVEAEGIYEALVEMGRKHLGGYLPIPWYYLPIPKPDGSWTNKPRAQSSSEGPKSVWLNPSPQDLFRAGWYTSEQLREWARGEGPVWPSCVALPAKGHPFWAAVRESVPKPDSARLNGNFSWDSFHANIGTAKLWTSIKGVGPKMAEKILLEREKAPFKNHFDLRDRVEGIGPKIMKRLQRAIHFGPHDWHDFPFTGTSGNKGGYTAYLGGNGFWRHAKDIWGFRLGNAYESRGALHLIFAADRKLAVGNDLPVFGYVTDEDKLANKVHEWNLANPDDIVEYQTYGSGSASLKRRLA